MFLHGPVECDRCWRDNARLDQEQGGLRLVRDPGHWGASNPTTLILGISKGNTQSSAYRSGNFDAVAFKGIRARMLEMFQSVGLLPGETLAAFEARFSSVEQDMAFASVVRCSLTGMDRRKGIFTADSPNVLPAFKPTSEAHQFVKNCVDTHLVELPSRTELVLLLGNTGSYVAALSSALDRQRGTVQRVNPIAYRSGGILFVHLAHPSKGNGHFGAYIRGEGTPGEKRDLAREALRGQN